MSVISKLASSLDRKDEVPNQLLAHEIVESVDKNAVRELAENLTNKNSAIASDCIKTLYEIGYLNPNLITQYVEEFVRLLFSKHNRLVWGAMITLSTIASLAPDKIFEARERIKTAMREGSVITIDNGVKVLALVAASKPEYGQELFPYLLDHLKRCRTKEVPQHAESTLVCVTTGNKQAFEQVLKNRMTKMIPSQVSRMKRLLKQTGSL